MNRANGRVKSEHTQQQTKCQQLNTHHVCGGMAMHHPAHDANDAQGPLTQTHALAPSPIPRRGPGGSGAALPGVLPVVRGDGGWKVCPDASRACGSAVVRRSMDGPRSSRRPHPPSTQPKHHQRPSTASILIDARQPSTTPNSVNNRPHIKDHPPSSLTTPPNTHQQPSLTLAPGQPRTRAANRWVNPHRERPSGTRGPALPSWVRVTAAARTSHMRPHTSFGAYPPPLCPLSAQISATTKRGCRPWAGSPWGPGNRGADLLLPLPPPTDMGPDRKQAHHTPPPACPRTLTAGRHMVIEVPPLTDRAERRVCWDLGPAW